MNRSGLKTLNDEVWRGLIRTHLDFLFTDYDFSITENIFYPEAFGNRLTTLESDKYIFRVEVDRRILGIYYKSKDYPSFKGIVGVLIGYLDNSFSSKYIDHSGSDEEQLIRKSSQFRENVSEIFALMEPDVIRENTLRVEEYLRKEIERKYSKKE